ncbi:uncharacterized protein LOC134775362 [Penaeus indicus]|uniref:uncharacterized protein LOC134775362 n=1 Tax=Penaeus indicus TaxID=29960 RepID=UPI00300CA369
MGRRCIMKAISYSWHLWDDLSHKVIPQMHRSLPSRPEPQPLVWVLGVVVGVVVAVVGLMMGLWWTKGRRSSHTLRNTEDDVTKLKNQDLAGDLRGQTDGLCMNGVVQHTIYDASGRYKGFGHLQQVCKTLLRRISDQ